MKLFNIQAPGCRHCHGNYVVSANTFESAKSIIIDYAKGNSCLVKYSQTKAWKILYQTESIEADERIILDTTDCG